VPIDKKHPQKITKNRRNQQHHAPCVRKLSEVSMVRDGCETSTMRDTYVLASHGDVCVMDDGPEGKRRREQSNDEL
jgi:hypothetical protein